MANPHADHDDGIPLDPDSDNDEDPGIALQGQPRRDRLERIALFDFLRLVAGNREPQPGFTTIEELVNHLKANDTITSDVISRAMLACPRDLFVPHPHRAEALADRPIRVEAGGFNISAPHVQAVSLQALALEQGQRVLDVGCGCGIVTAYAAYLTGSSGEVVGIDIRDTAIKLASKNLLTLKARNIEFPEVAAPIRFELHNVFIPLKRHLGRYDAVHVGGALPGSRLGALLDLLGPKGGRIVAPISNELRLVTKSPDGSVRQRVLSQVSFSELEVPRDVDVVLALLQEQAEADRRVEVPCSTFASDLAHLTAPGVDLQVVAAAMSAVTAGATTSALVQETESDFATLGSSHRGATSGGVRPRSDTSLADDHAAPATLPPAYRSGGSQVARPEEATIDADSADAMEGDAAAAASLAAPATGGWGWKWERPSAKADGGGVNVDMDVDLEAGKKSPLLGRTGMTEEMDAEVQAPAGPIGTEVAEADATVALQQLTTERRGDGDSRSDGCGDGDSDGGGGGLGLSYLTDVAATLAVGETDCELEGDGWRLPAHKAVLQARCELLRAHMGSGMRDSNAATYRVPEAVERREALEAFLHYVYKDCLPVDIGTELMPQLLHAGIYFGCRRLVRLCESLLARELVEATSQAGDDPEVLAAAVAVAGPLLALADEGGLDQLRRVAMQFVMDHFPAVSATEGYRQLPRPLVDEVAREALSRYKGVLKQLERLGEMGSGQLGEPDD